jgi:hypothetical protein
MKDVVFVSTLTLALAVSGAVFAQSTNVTPNAPAPVVAKQQKGNQQSALTIEKLTQDMQKAGFTEVKVLEDAFLIQAKTKDGNPIVMSIGPNGMSALEMAAPSTAGQASTTGQAVPDNKPVTAPAKPAQH